MVANFLPLRTWVANLPTPRAVDGALFGFLKLFRFFGGWYLPDIADIFSRNPRKYQGWYQFLGYFARSFASSSELWHGAYRVCRGEINLEQRKFILWWVFQLVQKQCFLVEARRISFDQGAFHWPKLNFDVGAEIRSAEQKYAFRWTEIRMPNRNIFV